MHLLLPLIITLVTCFIPNVANDQALSHENKITIDSLADIEALSYFLLWRYNYFEDENKKEVKEEKRILNFNKEAKLRTFIEDLKQDKLVENAVFNSSSSQSIVSSINCHNIDPQDIKAFQEKDISPLRLQRLCETANSCISARQMMDLISHSQASQPNGVKKSHLTISQAVVRLCPLMLFQLHDDKCVEEQKESHKLKNKPSAGHVWGFGLLFVTIVSFCSLIGVAIMPLLTKSTYNNILTLFEGLAVGSLVGSAIFHLIPQAFGLLGEDPDHGYLWKALIIFGGIYLFFCSERLMKIVVEFKRKKKVREAALPSCTSDNIDVPRLINQSMINRKVCFSDASNRPTNGVITASFSTNPEEINFVPSSPSGDNDETQSLPEKNNHNLAIYLTQNDDKDNQTNSLRDSLSLSSGCIDRERSRSNSFTFRHGHSHGNIDGKNVEIATVAWMIIFGDGLHNFIDGLSMGAAFSDSILSGISISVAVICEEFPHELGDFAVLIASGMTIRQAIGYNFLSACTCYLGLALGIALGDLTDLSPYIFALAGGMFLYIALVDMMGELSSSLDEASQRSMSETFKVLLLQNIGILVGVSSLLFLAKFSEKINFEGLAPPDQSDMPFTAGS